MKAILVNSDNETIEEMQISYPMFHIYKWLVLGYGGYFVKVDYGLKCRNNGDLIYQFDGVIGGIR